MIANEKTIQQLIIERVDYEMECLASFLGAEPLFLGHVNKARENIVKYLKSEVELEPWKGKDNLQFSKHEDYWLIIEHRKDKKTREVKQSKKKVPRGNIMVMYNVLKSRVAVGESVRSKELFEHICLNNQAPVLNEKEFYGARKTHYFPLFYYPMKVLEHLKFAEHGSRKITRLK